MISLDQFSERKRLKDGKYVEVFRMDDTKNSSEIPDMRKSVELGSCSCCDYFYADKNKIILVEETQVSGTIEDLLRDYAYLCEEDRENFFIKTIMQENYVKVYGTLLVLCRLAARCEKAKKYVSEKKYVFWLVAKNEGASEVTKYFDNLQNKLLNDLQSVLTSKVIDDVEIIPSEYLDEKLSRGLTAP